MRNFEASWRLDATVANRSLRIALLAVTGAFAFLIRFIVSFGQDGRSLHLFLVAMVYAGICCTIIFLQFRNKADERSVRICDGLLSIPRLILKPYQVHLHEIKSVEKYPRSRETIAVLIGRVEKSSIIIERRNFASDDDFEDFVGVIGQLVPVRRSGKPLEDIATSSSRRDPNKQHSLALLALIFVAVYAVSAYPEIDAANLAEIAHGGLIKQSLKVSELYRIASSFFLHYTPFHLIFNLLTLAVIGHHVEIIFGRARFLNVLFISAISGALVSLRFSHFGIVAGPSGGIMGLFGAYLVACLKFQAQLPGSVSMSRRTILSVLALQILSDITLSGIDAASHIGGFLFGVLYAICALHQHSLAQGAQSSRMETSLAVAVTLSFAAGLAYFLSARLY